MSELPLAPTYIEADFKLTMSDVQEWVTCTEYLTPTGFCIDFGLDPVDIPEMLKNHDVVRYAYLNILAKAEALSLSNLAGRVAMMNKIETALDMANTKFNNGMYDNDNDTPLFARAK